MSYRRQRTRRASPLKPWVAGLVACGVIVILFVVGVLAQRHGAGNPVGATVVSSAPEATPEVTPEPPGIGDAVRDGRFEFVVSRVDCSRRTVGVEHLERTADGRYCVVSLSVRNIADEPQFFLGHAQKAFDAGGVAYDNKEIAGIFANRNTETVLEKIDPGELVTGKLVFDVPKKVELAVLELHDSLLSGGVEVFLG